MDEAAAFVPSTFTGAQAPGYAYRSGPKGTGYYNDGGASAAGETAIRVAIEAHMERSRRAATPAKAHMEQQAQAQAIELVAMPAVNSTAGAPIGSTSAAIADAHFARKSYASTLLAAAKRKRTDTQGSQPRQRRMALNILSVLSVMSIASVGSLCSFLSFLSVGSFLSLGSVGSALSAWSVGSVLSIGSTGCTLHVFSDCTQPTPAPVVTWILDIDEDVFDLMETCSKAEYKSWPLSRPEKCDYQEDQSCTLIKDGETTEMPCELRRKGSYSWRDMRDKPSFKLKFDDKLELGEYACGNDFAWSSESSFAFGQPVCPPDETTNEWKTRRITLNNMVQPGFRVPYREVDAYDVFRKLGKKAIPLAEYAKVELRRGGALVREDVYVMLETIDDDDFIKKWFGSDHWLWEVEYNSPEEERDGREGETKDLADPDLLALNITSMEVDDAIRYYIGEILTRHWDGACYSNSGNGPNNHYFAFDGQKWTIMPWGMDQTFRGCTPKTKSKWGSEAPYCAFMQDCFRHETCRLRYHELLEAAGRLEVRTAPSCFEEQTLPIVVNAAIALGVVAASILIARLRGFDTSMSKSGLPRRAHAAIALAVVVVNIAFWLLLPFIQWALKPNGFITAPERAKLAAQQQAAPE